MLDDFRDEQAEIQSGLASPGSRSMERTSLGATALGIQELPELSSRERLGSFYPTSWPEQELRDKTWEGGSPHGLSVHCMLSTILGLSGVSHVNLPVVKQKTDSEGKEESWAR